MRAGVATMLRLAALAIAVVVAIAWWRRTAQSPPAPNERERLAETRDVASPAHSIRTDASPPAPTLAAPPKHARQDEGPVEPERAEPPSFDVEPLVAAGIERLAAEQMTAALRETWEVHERLAAGYRDGPAGPDSIRRKQEYLFAIWSRLGPLIEAGRVGVKVTPLHRRRTVTSGPNFWYGVVEDDLRASFQLASFSVSLELNDATLEPELRKRATMR